MVSLFRVENKRENWDDDTMWLLMGSFLPSQSLEHYWFGWARKLGIWREKGDQCENRFVHLYGEWGGREGNGKWWWEINCIRFLVEMKLNSLVVISSKCEIPKTKYINLVSIIIEILTNPKLFVGRWSMTYFGFYMLQLYFMRHWNNFF